MYGYVSSIQPIDDFHYVDCLLFGAMISAVDPGKNRVCVKPFQVLNDDTSRDKIK